MTDDTRTAVDISEFVRSLADLIGPPNVSTDLGDRTRASTDWAKMSPILDAQLPLGLCDVVAFPPSADAVADIVALAVEYRIPVTPRGKGTGNYGQAIPMSGGLVLDMSKANAIVEVDDGFITAEAGATMTSLESAARKHGQQLWMYPSTVGSSIGGFLSGGSGGTGTIIHGNISNGFVLGLDVAYADGQRGLHAISGDDLAPYLHAYGTTCVIARATVRLEPLVDWRVVYSSFESYEDALPLVRTISSMTPMPRLVSADVPVVVNALPNDAGYPHDRASLRAIVESCALDDVTSLIEAAGGRIEVIRHGPQASLKVSLLSYNHPTWHLQKTAPGRYFHIEVAGDALIDRYAEVDAVYEGSMLHIEGAYRIPIGMLNGVYRSREQVYAGINALRELGVLVHSPHEWYVDNNVDAVKALAARTDPFGLLNPGKLI